MARTTHSDLARELRIIADRLAAQREGAPCSDASTLHLIRSAANALDEQDAKLDLATEAIRTARETLARVLTRG